jgi:peptidoglycan/xylan/chitin deacetylase (PgdA/CDA1 family)
MSIQEDKYRYALENFDPAKYIKFNPDLSVKSLTETELFEHFKMFGYHEKRLFSSKKSKFPKLCTINIPIFCYHSQNVTGNSYRENDHIALQSDLSILKEQDYKHVNLTEALNLVNVEKPSENSNYFCLTFDDGSPFDCVSLEDRNKSYYGFSNILEDSQMITNQNKATSFVIVSERARRGIFSCLDNINWFLNESNCRLIDIGCHSYDHLHENAPNTNLYMCEQGRFGSINCFSDANIQVALANELLISLTKERSVPYFAYPYGELNNYLLKSYFPEHKEIHGFEAAFTTGGTTLNDQTSLWNIPRFVCGWHWNSENDLLELLNAISHL